MLWESVKHIFENDHIMENTPSQSYLYFYKMRQTNHFIAFKTVSIVQISNTNNNALSKTH